MDDTKMEKFIFECAIFANSINVAARQVEFTKKIEQYLKNAFKFSNEDLNSEAIKYAIDSCLNNWNDDNDNTLTFYHNFCNLKRQINLQ